MPIIGAVTGGLDFSNYYVPLAKSVTADTLVEAKKQGAVLAWGNFLTVLINFIIIAAILFVIVNIIQELRRQEADKPAPATARQEKLLEEIRDLLANQQKSGGV
jgi:large conductance mechanosensitive channel